MRFHFEESWLDSRLSWNITHHIDMINAPAELVSHIWLPDLYFVNDILTEASDVPTSNTIFRLTPDGRVRYTRRLVDYLSNFNGIIYLSH